MGSEAELLKQFVNTLQQTTHIWEINSTPRLAWKACLKHTGIRSELLTDPNMLLMFEHGIRGGITQAVRKYTTANNPYMGDKFDPKEDTTYLQYLNANSL